MLPDPHHVVGCWPALASDDHAKDIDFSPDGIRARWDAGYLRHGPGARQAPWTAQTDPRSFVLP